MPSQTEKAFRYKKRRNRFAKKGLTPKQRKAVNSMIQTNNNKILEKKHWDTEGTELSIVSTYTNTSTYDLFSPPSGNLDTERIGDMVTLRSIFLRYNLEYNENSSYVNMTVRVMIVQWLQDSNTTGDPSPTEFIQNLTGLHDSYNPRKIDKNSKHNILYDKFHELNRYDIASTTEVWIDTRFRKKVKFTQAATSGVGKIYLVVLHGDTAAIPADNPNISYRSRVRYFDG